MAHKITDKSTLIGIIVDVSYSMKSNWSNEDGRDMPRIKMVQEALNTQIKKASLRLNDEQGNVELFCLGMGFRRTMYLSNVLMSYDKEIVSANLRDEQTMVDIVCDLLALSEIVPSQNDLLFLEKEIRKRWDRYTRLLIDRSTNIDDAIYDELKEIIRNDLEVTANKKLGIFHKTARFLKKLRALSDISHTKPPTSQEPLKISDFAIWRESRKKVFVKLYRFFRGWERRIDDYITQCKEKITDTSLETSEKYVDGILGKSRGLFEEEKNNYEEFIQETIGDFVDDLVGDLLTFLTLGFPVEKVVDHFSEDKVLALAQQIYQHLEEKVKNSVLLAWTEQKIHLSMSSWTSLNKGTIKNKNTVEEMTKECVQKCSWDLLEEFVENLVASIFTAKFEEKAQEQIPHWLGLASSREVTRNLTKLLHLLPDSSEDIQLYSDQFMFGSTPIYNALNLASLRFQDESWNDYRKVLVIISDGDFETNSPLEVADMLKDVGVTIVSCCLTPNDIMTKLVRRSESLWPDGAKKMLDMASTMNEHDELWQDLTDSGVGVPDGVKLFYQINQSDLLEDIFESLFDE